MSNKKCNHLFSFVIFPNRQSSGSEKKSNQLFTANLSKVAKSLKQTPWTRSLFAIKKHWEVTLEGLLWDDLARRNRGTQADGLLWELNHASFAFLTQSGTCAVNPTCTALIYGQRRCGKDYYLNCFRQSRGDTDLAQKKAHKTPLKNQSAIIALTIAGFWRSLSA